jgi:hypothetical protein
VQAPAREQVVAVATVAVAAIAVVAVAVRVPGGGAGAAPAAAATTPPPAGGAPPLAAGGGGGQGAGGGGGRGGNGAGQSVGPAPVEWIVHFEGDGKDAKGAMVHYVVDGKIENIGLYNRSLTGTWVSGNTKGTFKLVRQ